MKLLTASYQTLRPGLGVPVVASLTLPPWLKPEVETWPRCWPLSPRWSYWHSDDQEFEMAFLAQLERYGVDRIRERLAEIAEQEQADTLLITCWERDATECHRGTWRCWWHEQTGEWIDDVSDLRLA